METETRNMLSKKHKMSPQKITTRIKKTTQGTTRLTSSKIDQNLLWHLVSPHQFECLSYLIQNNWIQPQESPFKNWLG
jgi:hypothetical protein